MIDIYIKVISMRFITVLLAGLLSLWCTESAYAARLLTFTIEVNGQKVFETMHTDDGLAKPAEVWSYLRSTSFKATGKLPSEPGEEMQMKLQGTVVIRAIHAGRTLAEAKVTELTLTRPNGTGAEWSLPTDEVVRTAGIAGLSLPPSEPVGQTQPWQWWARGISIFILLAIVVSMVVRRLGGKKEGVEAAG